MQFWALVVDGSRESRDKKIFWVVLAITLLIALAMLCIGFDGRRVSFFFGLVKGDAPESGLMESIGRTQLVGVVVWLLLETIFGWIGIVLMIVATAGMIPAFLERGVIDVVLAKPLSRPKLFLYKYLAGLVFVVVQSFIFVGATFLVMGFRWGLWVPGYLLAAPLLVLLFSYVYCVSVWVAVKTRSAIAAVLLSLGAWVVFALVHQGPMIFETFPALKEYRTLHAAVRAAAWIPPKTGDIIYFAARWAEAGTSAELFTGIMPRGAMDAEDRQQIDVAMQIEEKEILKSSISSVGSSLLFEAVVVLLAMWSFARKDY